MNGVYGNKKKYQTRDLITRKTVKDNTKDNSTNNEDRR